MVVLTGNGYEPIIVALDDGSEIEITITESEGNKAEVVIYADQSVSVVRKHLASSEN